MGSPGTGSPGTDSPGTGSPGTGSFRLDQPRVDRPMVDTPGADRRRSGPESWLAGRSRGRCGYRAPRERLGRGHKASRDLVAGTTAPQSPVRYTQPERYRFKPQSASPG